ncbi:hypothetical protein EXN51_07435 [Agrobacterium fabrum]|uniref:Phosphoglyceromutase n=1 Tax=Agrobacterium fabrum (strain C58 / ATCC 33970) TaxID=176299 RepID=Q7CRD2_AGRFC|nr:phosphoglyceromutase [Agrobacterium fabrum str. C58]TRB29634.1 hypothetical protein EXN51_07435 [Agrobacterium fabrum]
MALPTIYLLRHGETLWNSLGRFQGQLDSPLTPRGVEQADQVARLLRDALNNDNQLFQMQISPLGRVRQTAERVQYRRSCRSRISKMTDWLRSRQGPGTG